jgi:hypothetical protein
MLVTPVCFGEWPKLAGEGIGVNKNYGRILIRREVTSDYAKIHKFEGHTICKLIR